MLTQLPSWPYLPTLARIGLAIAIGLFIGIERRDPNTFTIGTGLRGSAAKSPSRGGL